MWSERLIVFISILKINFTKENQQSQPLLKKRNLSFCSIIFFFNFYFQFSIFNLLKLFERLTLGARKSRPTRECQGLDSFVQFFPLVKSVHAEVSSLCLFQRSSVEAPLLKAVKGVSLSDGFAVWAETYQTWRL